MSAECVWRTAGAGNCCIIPYPSPDPGPHSLSPSLSLPLSLYPPPDYLRLAVFPVLVLKKYYTQKDIPKKRRRIPALSLSLSSFSSIDERGNTVFFSINSSLKMHGNVFERAFT